MIERICSQCHKRIVLGSMLKIYCQGHGGTFKEKQVASRLTREIWIKNNPPDEFGYWGCYLRISPMCLKRINEQTLSIEHMIPKSRGIQYRHDQKNLKPSCSFCNTQKGSRTVKSLARDFPHLKEDYA